MLIAFSVANFGCIDQKQTLSMEAEAAYKELPTHVFQKGKHPLLRACVLYGPNGAGKSTVINALQFLDHLVAQSHRSQVNEPVGGDGWFPFKLKATNRQADSEFEITFIEGDIHYTYGVHCNRTRITREYLKARELSKGGQTPTYFDRTWDTKTQKNVYKFGDALKPKQYRAWSAETIPNMLFLSKAVQNNDDLLRNPFEWFQKRLLVISSGSPSNGYTATACLDTEKKQEVLAFMKAAELPAADIQVEEIPFDSSQLPDDMPTAIREHVIQELQGSKQLKVRFLLPDVETQESIVFRHDEISTGTCALFAWAGPWLDVEKNNCVLVVDELDSSLHPLLVQQLVQRMNHGKGQAQLICTTHDTSLLSAQHVLRRDQVWFVEKNPQTCAADLYPLSALSPRLGEAIQTRYLSGRYGGIPRIERWDDPPQED